MTFDPRSLALELLGDDPGGELSVVATSELPERPTGLGDAGALRTDALAAWLEAHPHFSPLDAGGVRARVADLDPRIVVVGGIKAAPSKHAGDVTMWGDDTVVLSVANGPAALRAEDGEGPFVLLAVPSGEGRSRGALSVLRSTRPALDAPFDSKAALAGWSAAPWLDAYASAPGSGADALVRCGTIARLWMPSTAVDRDRALAGAGTPVDFVRARREALGPEPCASLLEIGAKLARRIEREVEDLSARAIDAPEPARTLAVEILERRDDLASIAFMLERSSAQRAELQGLVDDADRALAAHASVFALVAGEHGSERLAAVAWQEPDAWWGQVLDP